MANDISNSSWTEADASNSSAAPNGFPEGMAPSAVNDAARMVMGAVKRFWDRINGTLTSTGTGNAYVLTYTVAPIAYIPGEAYTFKIHAANTAAATVNINGLGAKNLYKPSSAGPVALASGDLQPGNFVTAIYDGTQLVIDGLPSSLGTITSVAGAGIATGSATTGAATVTVPAAVKSDMQAGTSTTTAVTPARVNDADGVAKAWVEFGGASGTILASFNVSSITHNGAGDYTVNFTTPFATANYAMAGTASNDAGSSAALTQAAGTAPTASAMRIFAAGGDPTRVFAVFYGRQ